jgi:arylsulfatase A-like enzyme
VLAVFLAASVFSAEKPTVRPPNILFVIADDLGYGDLGCFGQKKIRTPNLDRLAAEGIKLTRHYSGSPVCAPSRCVLMSGKHSGHAFIRDNRQHRKDGEGQYPIPDELMILPELLKARGYRTGVFGKWGLGAPDTTGEPLKQGVDRFFGYNCQAVAHNFYPTYLWDDARKRPLANPKFAAHQKFPKEVEANDLAAFARYSGTEYSADLIAKEAEAFVRANKDQPFFLFHSSTIPHLALQAPADALQEYAGAFPEEPYLGNRGYLPHATPRACYAAMVTRLDRHVGRLLNALKECGIENDTIVVFTSDNGPLYDRHGGTDTEFFNSAAGLRGRKGSVYEGGMRVPTIVRWPGKVKPGTESDRVTGFEDWLPTLLDAIGAADRTPKDVDGISFAATLDGKPQPERPFLYREFPGYGGQQMVRVGDWKAVRQQLRRAAKQRAEKLPTELYNLAADPLEATDVAANHAEVVARLEALMKREHVRSAVFPLPGVDGP